MLIDLPVIYLVEFIVTVNLLRQTGDILISLPVLICPVYLSRYTDDILHSLPANDLTLVYTFKNTSPVYLSTQVTSISSPVSHLSSPFERQVTYSASGYLVQVSRFMNSPVSYLVQVYRLISKSSPAYTRVRRAWSECL